MRPEKLTQFMTGKQTSVAIHTRLLTAFGLFLLVAIGIWLRFANLDNFGLDRDEDEDIMGIAVMGIAEYGEPRFPSGMVYLRSLPVSYMMAASTGLLGLNEIGLRAPSALFGTLLIILTFFLCRRYFGMAVALIAVFLVSVSFWQVDVSRTARMYAPFGALYLGAVFAACVGYIESRRSFQWICLLLSVLATLVHALGVVFGGVLLALALRPSKDWHARTVATINAALLAVVYLALPPMDLSGLPTSESASAAGSEAPSNIADTMLGVLGVFVTPPLQLLSDGAAGVIHGIAIIGLGIAVAYLLHQNPRSRFTKGTFAAFSAVAVGAACHQLIIAMLGLCGLALLTGRHQARLLWAAGLICLAAGISWTSYGLFLHSGDVENTVKQLLGYPQAKQWISFIEHRWVAAVFALTGGIVALRDALAARTLTPPSLLAMVAAFTLFSHSILDSQFRTRYNFAVDALFLIFVAYGIWWCVAWIARRFQLRAVAAPAIALASLVAFDLGAHYSIKLPRVNEASVGGALGPDYDLRPDYRGAALYVKERLAAGDQVMSTDWLTTYFYTGQVDYLLRGPPHSLHQWMQLEIEDSKYELYLASQWVTDGGALTELLHRPCSSSLWIVTSKEALQSEAKLIPGWEGVAQALRKHHRFSGARESTDVYFIPAPACDDEVTPINEPLA